MAEELKPCPFCGYSAEVKREGSRRQSMQIHCTDCGCLVESCDVGSYSAWNTRAEHEYPLAAIFVDTNLKKMGLESLVDLEKRINEGQQALKLLRMIDHRLDTATNAAEYLVAGVHISNKVKALLGEPDV